MGERKVREGRVVSWWWVEKRGGWDENGKGLIMEEFRVVENKEIRSGEG